MCVWVKCDIYDENGSWQVVGCYSFHILYCSHWVCSLSISISLSRIVVVFIQQCFLSTFAHRNRVFMNAALSLFVGKKNITNAYSMYAPCKIASSVLCTHQNIAWIANKELIPVPITSLYTDMLQILHKLVTYTFTTVKFLLKFLLLMQNFLLVFILLCCCCCSSLCIINFLPFFDANLYDKTCVYFQSLPHFLCINDFISKFITYAMWRCGRLNLFKFYFLFTSISLSICWSNEEQKKKNWLSSINWVRWESLPLSEFSLIKNHSKKIELCVLLFYL